MNLFAHLLRQSARSTQPTMLFSYKHMSPMLALHPANRPGIFCSRGKTTYKISPAYVHIASFPLTAKQHSNNTSSLYYYIYVSITALSSSNKPQYRNCLAILYLLHNNSLTSLPIQQASGHNAPFPLATQNIVPSYF